MTLRDDINPKTHDEQLKKLYLDQKHTLDLFLERGAITRSQYDKSPGELKKKLLPAARKE